MKYFILAFLWTGWCTFHSFLISLPVTEFLNRRLANGFRYYRILYNGFAAITLVPVAMYAYTVRTEALFRWEGPFRIVRVLLLLVSTFLFVSGARRYDLLQFLGIHQIKQSNACPVLTENCELDTTGILSIIRHPWYLGGMIIVWARDLDVSAIVSNTIITGYFVVGTLLEERKLRTVLGNTYGQYQKQVSMFFPYKWLKAKLRRHGS